MFGRETGGMYDLDGWVEGREDFVGWVVGCGVVCRSWWVMGGWMVDGGVGLRG